MFVRRSEEEILEQLLARVISDTEISVTSPGGIARTLLEIISQELGHNYALFDINMSQMFLSSAGGEALSKLGTLLGVQRNTVNSSITADNSSVYFYLSAADNHYPGRATAPAPTTIVIPSGTILSTNELSSYNLPERWRVTQQTVLAEGEYMAYVPVEPLDIVPLKQTTPAGMLVHHDVRMDNYDIGANTLYVYNREPLQATSSQESDDNYRFRISKQIRQLASGNALAIRLASLAIPGVRDAKVYPLANGIGTFKVVVVPEVARLTGNDTVLGNVAVAVSDVKSVGDLAFVDLATPHKVDITGAITISNSSSASAQTLRRISAEAIANYINSLSAGDKLSISRITHAALSVSPEITGFVFRSGNGLEIDDTAQPISDYNVTKDEQLFAGLITVA